MHRLPSEGYAILQQFRALFTAPSFCQLLQLTRGTLLCVGARTVCAALRFLGLADKPGFCNYHRFLSRARWNALAAARILLGLLIDRFCTSPSQPIVFSIDETIERRRGALIKAKGIYRDPVRSSGSHFVKCSGLRWMCMMLLVAIPWAASVWALPFLTALAPSERYNQTAGKRHKKITDWARQMMLLVARWLKGRKVIVTADSSYSVLELLDSVRYHLTLITRLRMDAALYDPVVEASKKNPGRPRLKDKRQPNLEDRLKDQAQSWIRVVIPQWYDQRNKTIDIATGTAVWYHSGKAPVPIRWVLLRDPDGKGDPAALLSTDLSMEALEIVTHFVCRWTEEVTLKEVRTHLGVETQRQWSDNAIARATPALMALFSITTLWADKLQKSGKLVIEQTQWYKKTSATFSDALAAVRKQLWEGHDFCTSGSEHQTLKIPLHWLNFLTDRLARAC